MVAERTQPTPSADAGGATPAFFEEARGRHPGQVGAREAQRAAELLNVTRREDGGEAPSVRELQKVSLGPGAFVVRGKPELAAALRAMEGPAPGALRLTHSPSRSGAGAHAARRLSGRG